MSNRQTIVDTAVAWLGRKESDGSHREIIDVYNTINPLPRGYKMTYTAPWCAAYVSAVAKKAGMLDIIFAECSCSRMIALFKEAGRWMESDSYTPQKGDIIFYDWDDDGKGENTGAPEHVGIVVSVGSKNIKVIEGNRNDDCGYRNIAVNGKYIRGYGLPNYEGKPIEEQKQPEQAATVTAIIKVPQIEKGAIGNSVKSLQLLLIGNGVSCGYTGADGEFGSMTEKAVITWQKKKSLEADGIVGVETWTSLLN